MSENLPLSKVEQTINLYLKFTESNNLKIVAVSFSGLKTIEKVFGESLARQGKYKPILDVIIAKLKEHNADKIIKINVIACLGPIFKNIFDKLNEADQNQVLITVEEKLRV